MAEPDPLTQLPAWMKELSSIIQLQLDLIASMSRSVTEGQRAQHISASPTGESDLDGLRVRFASVQQTLQSGQISEQCDSESGKGGKGFGLLGREDRPCFERPDVFPMACIKEGDENADATDAADAADATGGFGDICEFHDDGSRGSGNHGNHGHFGFSQGIQGIRGNADVMESYDKRIMESMVVEKENRFPNGLLNPRWIGKLGWDFGVMFFVLMDAIVLPFQLTFKSNANSDQMDTFDLGWLWITTLVFATDILLSFNTAVERGERDRQSGKHALILDRCQIAKLYLRGWFIIDFGSAVPWAQISEAFYSGDSSQLTRLTKVVKFVRLLRLVRMLRLAKLKTIWERMEIRIGSVYIIQCISLLRVLSVVVAMCHWSACLFWLIGLPRNLFTELMSDEEQLAYEAAPHWTTVWRRHSNEQSEPWRWLDRSISETYVFCFYWTLGVMRTMPAEVTPVNLPERVFVLIFMFFALSAFAISIALITQSFFKLSERRKTFNEEYVALRLHLQKTKVSEDVQGRVKAYLTHLFTRRRIQAKEANLLNVLPENLREEVFRCQASHHMCLQLPVMSSFRRSQRLRLAAAAATCDFMPGETVVQKGEIIDAAWILMTGQLHQDGWDIEEFPTVVHAECLGQLEHEACEYSEGKVVATEMSEVLKVDKANFLRIAKSFSGNKEHVDPVRGTRRPELKRSMSGISDDRGLRDGSDEMNNSMMRATVAVVSTS